MNRKKKLQTYLACLGLTGTLSLTGCSLLENSETNQNIVIDQITKTQSTEQLEENDKEKIKYLINYTAVVLDGGNAILYDMHSYDVNLTENYVFYIEMPGSDELTRFSFPREIVRLFENHETAEEYALLVVGDTNKIICMYNPEHDLSNVEEKIKIYKKTR